MARHDPLMALRLIYQMFTKILGWIVLHTRSDTTKDIEILVLRHQLSPCSNGTPAPTDELVAARARGSHLRRARCRHRHRHRLAGDRSGASVSRDDCCGLPRRVPR
jgi:hypothetical protein